MRKSIAAVAVVAAASMAFVGLAPAATAADGVTVAKGIVAKLDEFRSKGHDVREILKTSVMSGWSGVFEPKNMPPAASQGRGFV